jgi:predicted molibdopterin-dependent oxidoreductase YjgC
LPVYRIAGLVDHGVTRIYLHYRLYGLVPTIVSRPRLFAERFAHDDGLARLVAVTVRTSARPSPADGELTLVTGRLLEHYQSGAQTRLVPELLDAQPDLRASLHPATADRLGIGDGDHVEIANARGVVRVEPLIREAGPADLTLWEPHYGRLAEAQRRWEAAHGRAMPRA